MANQDFNFDFQEFSSFQLGFLLLSFLGIILTLLVGFQADNTGVIVLAIITFIMLSLGLFFSQGEILKLGTWRRNSTYFTLGAGTVYFLLGAGQQATTGIFSQNVVYNTLASQIPQYTDFIFSTFLIPVAEEYVWMIAIPIGTYGILKALPFKINEYASLALVTLIASTTFAYFHVGKLIPAFLAMAMIFRGLLTVLVVGDIQVNWIPTLEFLPAFAFGAHIMNNWLAYGFQDGLDVLFSGTNTFQTIISTFIIGGLLAITITGAYTILQASMKYFSQ